MSIENFAETYVPYGNVLAEDIRQKVESTVEELGYSPIAALAMNFINEGKDGLRSGKNPVKNSGAILLGHTIIAIDCSLTDGSFDGQNYIEGIKQSFAEAGYNTPFEPLSFELLSEDEKYLMADDVILDKTLTSFLKNPGKLPESLCNFLEGTVFTLHVRNERIYENSIINYIKPHLELYEAMAKCVVEERPRNPFSEKLGEQLAGIDLNP